ncbi:acyl-CoA dehydrogenase family protein [Chloroflexota bacterium]
MDFSLEYTKGQEEFANEVRKWLDENIPKDLISPRDAKKLSYEQWQKRRELGRKLGEKGWLNPEYLKEYGGSGLDADHSFVLHEELGKRNLGLPPYYDSGERRAVPPLMTLGTEEQKKRFLPPILKGEVITWQLFTEPEAGTDEANQQTSTLRHIRDKDHFIINGQKIFVGGIYAPPDQFVMLTRSDLEAPRHENLSMFLVPANLPGITIQPLGLFISAPFHGASGHSPTSAEGDKHSVFFDGVRVHESYLIGKEGDGWKAANATLAVEHGDRSGDVGIRAEVARNVAVEKLLEQCRSNPNIVKRLRENPQLLDSVVDIYIDAQLERLFSMRNIWLLLSGRRVPYAGPQLTMHEKMFGTRFINDTAKVLGPYTLTDDSEWGLDEDIFEVLQRGGVCIAPGGTPEAIKIVISRALRIGR